MKEVMRAMWLTKLRTAAVTLAVLGVLGLGVGLFAGGVFTPQPAAAEGPAPEKGPSPTAARSDDKDAASGDVGAAAQGSNPQELARQKAQSRLNLKSLALAMHHYHDVFGHWPAPAIYGNSGLQGGGPELGVEPGSASGPGGPGGPIGGADRGGSRPPGVGAGAPMPGGVSGRPRGPSGPAPGGGRPGPAHNPGAPGGVGGPPAMVKQGKALLSWRVALLPFIGEDQLYKQFKLDEPWDSPHNKKLLTKIPKIYADPTGKSRDPSATYYQVFVGPHAAFEKHAWYSVAHVPDGLSNTIFIVEAANPVPWTKPEDLHFAPDEPIPELGGVFPGLFHAAFGDGAVYAISKKIDPGTLRNAIMRDDGQVINLEPYTIPASQRTAALKEHNDRLRQELQREKKRLEQLQKEKSLLQEIEDDAEVQRLKRESQDLEALLRKSRDEADRLKEEIQRLKRSSGKGAGDRGPK
jgi:hypothetical protein